VCLYINIKEIRVFCNHSWLIGCGAIHRPYWCTRHFLIHVPFDCCILPLWRKIWIRKLCFV